MDSTTQIRLEILKGSHLEHFKVAKEMSMFLDSDNSRKKSIEDEANKIIAQIHKLNKK